MSKQRLTLRSTQPTAQRRSGYSLAELLVGMAASTVLMAGLASALYISSFALDASSDSQQSGLAGIVLNDIMADLRHAQMFTERTATTIGFTVPDRDGDNASDLIRYAWSGNVGDPLYYQYNGGNLQIVALNVQYFNVSALTREMLAPVVGGGGGSNPVLLFVSGKSSDGDGGLGTPTAAEQLLITEIEGWGYDVTVISQEATQAEFDTDLTTAAVVYVPAGISHVHVGTKLDAATIGVVIEPVEYCEQVGLSSSNSYTPMTEFDVKNILHYITSEHPLGSLTIAGAAIGMKIGVLGYAPGGIELGSHFPSPNTFPTFVAVSPGGQFMGGGTAAGRRVQLPWGENLAAFTSLNAAGLDLMRRSIDWAAGAGDDLYPNGVVFEGLAEKQESGSTTSTTVSVPTGSEAGDLLIAAVVTDGDQASSLSPSATGWNEILVASESGSKVTLGVWWRLATASEPSNYTFSWSGGEKTYSWIMRFSGHDPANPIHVTAIAEGDSISPVAPSVTTTIDNCLILRLGGFDDDDVTNGDAGMTDHTTIAANESNHGTSSSSGAAACEIQNYAGSTGTANFTLVDGEEFRTLTIAIAPE